MAGVSSSNLVDPNVVKIRVSSVLNRDVKQFGKNFMFDGLEDTCWNSDQGTPQWVQMNFPTPIVPERVEIQFQGGFAGQECWVEGASNEAENPMQRIQDIYPEDSNALQVFDLNGVEKEIKVLRLVFNTSTDFFGRIVIYKLAVYGKTHTA